MELTVRPDDRLLELNRGVHSSGRELEKAGGKLLDQRASLGTPQVKPRQTLAGRAHP